MRFQVIRLRDQGKVLRRTELPAPVTGMLVVEDWPAPNALRRSVRRAQILGGSYSIPVLLMPAIFDPQILRSDDSGLYIAGIELDTENHPGPPSEHMQIWLCLPETEKGPTPAP